MRLILPLAVLCLALGCVTLRGQADQLLAQRQYAEAADLYDRILDQDPTDAEALQRRQVARKGAMRSWIAEEQSLRQAKRSEEARRVLTQILAKAQPWANALEADDQRAIQAAIDAHRAEVSAAVRADLQRGAPRAADERLRAVSLLSHPAFADLRSSLEGEVKSEGTKRCQDLVASTAADQPYWTWLVDQDCQRWGVRIRPLPPLPVQRSDLVVAGGVAGADEASLRSLTTGVHQWFSHTPWFDPRAKEPGQATLSGVVGEQRSNRPVTLEKLWTEEVPYIATETYEEPYQEPYTDTETYSKEVPYTAQETYDYPCGHDRSPRTCQGTRSVTRYRTEPRTRTVTKYRTAYRTLTREVTRYRPEPRTFNYQAVEHTVRHSSAMSISIDRGPGAEPFVIQLNGSSEQKGISHQADFAPAGVHPQQADLPTIPIYMQKEIERFRVRFEDALTRRYLDLYCSSGRPTREQAAQCMYAAPDPVPVATKEALAAALGADLPLIVADVRRWAKEGRK